LKRECLLLLVAALAGCLTAAAQSNPLSTDARTDYASVKRVILMSADMMPAENYSFRTTPLVRTYGELIAHIADAQIAICSAAKGESKHGDAKGKTSKTDLVAALKASFDYCDPVYDSMTDQSGAQVVKLFENDRTKLGALFFNNTHDNETYGTMVAYLRIKGLVPPGRH
jgi:hypothetical protein